MSWSECATASDFVQRRRSELLAHESRHCLAWGAVNRCQSAPKKVAITRFLIYTTGSISSAHALLTDHDQHLILSAMTDSEAGQLRDDLRRRQTSLLTIEGPAERAAQFVADWIEERGVKERTRMNQGLYELRTVSDMPSVAGAMVCATEDHLEHTERLMQGFIGSIGEQPIDAEHISEPGAPSPSAEPTSGSFPIDGLSRCPPSSGRRPTQRASHGSTQLRRRDETATQPNWLRRSRRRNWIVASRRATCTRTSTTRPQTPSTEESGTA